MKDEELGKSEILWRKDFSITEIENPQGRQFLWIESVYNVKPEYSDMLVKYIQKISCGRIRIDDKGKYDFRIKDNKIIMRIIKSFPYVWNVFSINSEFSDIEYEIRKLLDEIERVKAIVEIVND